MILTIIVPIEVGLVVDALVSRSACWTDGVSWSDMPQLVDVHHIHLNLLMDSQAVCTVSNRCIIIVSCCLHVILLLFPVVVYRLYLPVSPEDHPMALGLVWGTKFWLYVTVFSYFIPCNGSIV